MGTKIPKKRLSLFVSVGNFLNSDKVLFDKMKCLGKSLLSLVARYVIISMCFEFNQTQLIHCSPSKYNSLAMGITTYYIEII